MTKQLAVTVIGGGTGTYSVLMGMKRYTSDITAVVSMADTGGSAKIERDEWGLLPSSDVRKSLIALADVSTEDSVLLRGLFQYRFHKGIGISGMTFGNLFLATLTKLLGSQEEAIEKAGKLLKIKGRVLPVSLKPVHLVAEYDDGSVVVGEHDIDDPKHDGTVTIKKLSIKLHATLSRDVRDVIERSDLIVLGPGGFYTTLCANLVVGGVSESIVRSKAKKIFVVNLMTEYGQTYGFTASKFLKELDTYLPVSCLDGVVINTSPIPNVTLKRYEASRAIAVVNDLPKKASYKVIAADLLSDQFVTIEKGDTLKRSFIRHSPDKLASVCVHAFRLV